MPLPSDPIVEIHPETAEKHEIGEKDWVWVALPRGRAKLRAKYNDGIDDGIDSLVVAAEHGWYYPEDKSPGHGRLAACLCRGLCYPIHPFYANYACCVRV